MEQVQVLDTFTACRTYTTDTYTAFTTSTVKRVKITTTSRYEPATSPLQFRIQFNFSRKSRFTYWVPNPNNHDDRQQLESSHDSQPPDVRSIVLCRCELLNRSKASLLLHQLLNYWFPFERNWGPHWIHQVLERARDGIGSTPAGHNMIVVDFHCVVDHDVLYYYAGPVSEDEPMFEYEGANNNFMVPSKESWIQSVVENKIVLMDSSETCTVCLEDFSDDGGEGVLMPCGHVFHGDCIGHWLRTSHYCPVCRFQLPTD